MKGLEELTWTFIQIAVVLIVVAWVINPIYNSIQAAQQNSARLNAQEIAGIINTMKASSGDMSYKSVLPSLTCKVEITEKFVKFNLSAGGKEQFVVLDLIQTPVKVQSQKSVFECRQKSLNIERRGNIIRVS